jgi:hypothetical protein
MESIQDIEKQIKIHLIEIERLTRRSIFLSNYNYEKNKQKSSKPIKRNNK